MRILHLPVLLQDGFDLILSSQLELLNLPASHFVFCAQVSFLVEFFKLVLIIQVLFPEFLERVVPWDEAPDELEIFVFHLPPNFLSFEG